MFIHQSYNSIGGNVFNGYVYCDIGCKNHIHKSFELAIVLDGEVEAVIGERSYIVKRGQAVLSAPYQTHRYSSKADNLVYVVVFSSNYVGEFSRLTGGKIPRDALITLDSDTLNFVKKNLIGEFDFPQPRELRENAVVLKVDNPSVLTIKACLYALCAEFFCSTEFVDKNKDNALIFEILSYVEENYTQDISLLRLSKKLGYDHRYLSRVFGQCFEINFKTLVNQYRFDKARELIDTTDESLAAIAMDSGFQSIRSFNRVFVELMGISPSEYRDNKPKR